MPRTISGRGYLANTGEVFAWLSQDPESADRFAAWYNRTATELGADKPLITWEDVTRNASNMEHLSGVLLAQMVSRGMGESPL